MNENSFKNVNIILIDKRKYRFNASKNYLSIFVKIVKCTELLYAHYE